MKEIRLSKSSAKFIESSDKVLKHRIKLAIEGLLISPPKGDIKI